jgi:hypothetical protein
MGGDRTPKEAKERNTRPSHAHVNGGELGVEAHAPLRLDPSNILHLQRTVGNQTVQRLVAEGKLAPAPQSAFAGQTAGGSHKPRKSGRVAHTIQRFGSSEHMKIGNQATQGEHGEIRTVQLADDYRITYGEMVAMAGDYFESIAQMREFAANTGTGPGTREELEYVRVVEIHNKKDQAGSFSKSAINAAKKRYYELAGGNRSHFLNPEVGDENRTIEDKGDDLITEYRLKWQGLWPQIVTSTAPLNAGAGYRKNHFQALYEAYFAGYQGETIDSALAVEAFGAHYLTDAFAAGHIRTPRASMTQHWNQRVPMFNYNLKGFIAERLSERLEKTIAGGIFTEEAIFKGPLWFEGALSTVTATLDSKGFITFGDVVSGAIHDYDNERGVEATILGQDVTLYGDSHLGQGDEETFATDAVRLSAQDVAMAWEYGKKQENPLSLLNVLLQDGLFAAEQLLPNPKADSELSPSEQRVKWDYDTVESLLGDAHFAEALRIFAREKAGEFAAAAKEFNDADKEKAFMEAIVEPLKADPVEMIRQVINWTPDTGGGILGHNQDDNALDYYEEAKRAGALETLTRAQKKALILNLLDGATVGDEEDAIMDLLKANEADARVIISEIGWERLEDEIDDWAGSDFADRFPEAEYAR